MDTVCVKCKKRFGWHGKEPPCPYCGHVVKLSEKEKEILAEMKRFLQKRKEQKMKSAMEETLNHIKRVRELLNIAQINLSERALVHDKSKLESPEAEEFERLTPLLRGTTYGSEEYKRLLVELGDALKHHYEHNSHHPEHYPDGIEGMSLFDILEMLLDWRAATERHADGCILKSIEINQKRFGYSDSLKKILLNTIKELGL
jgi:DNA-directed RNA polymerase subunit RPC12/RpoP